MKNKKKEQLLIKIGDFIVNFRYLFLILFIGLFVFCFININNVKVNDSIVSYLPDKTETKSGLNIMEDEFGNLVTMKLMVSNLSLDKASNLKEKIVKIKGIDVVSFSGKEDSYKDKKALYTIQIIDATDDEINKITKEIKKIVQDESFSLYSEYFEDPTAGITIVLLLAIVVIIVILFVTSKTYFEPVIAFIIFLFSIVLNMGSNFLLGEISYITKSIAVILQLALSIDYVIIFMNQFMKEIGDTDDKLLAVKKTTSKAMPEIFASSLTTISGLMALVFMKLKIGGDIGIVLSKGIIWSLLTVILLMPCLLLLFSNVIIKLKRKEKNRNLDSLNQFIVSKRKILLLVFLILVLISAFLSTKYQFAYNASSVKSIKVSENVGALNQIENTFGKENMLVVLIKNKNKNYQNERILTEKLREVEDVTSVTSIGGYEFKEGIYLGSEMNYKDFSKLLEINPDMSLKLYKLYASQNEEIEKLSDIDNYKVTVIEWIHFLSKPEQSSLLNNEIKSKIYGSASMIEQSMSLLESDEYTRFILNLDIESESDEINDVVKNIRNVSEKYYDDVILVGNSINAIDLESSFTSDNMIITGITIAFIAVILLFSFKSFGITLLLILTIEGSILINFGITALLGGKIFFMSYVVVSAIQMGATIDYAIVIASRYLKLRQKYDKKEALIGTLSDSLPAVITSGLILLISGFLIGFISTSSVISSIGIFLGVGTLISLIATIFVLPAILYAGDTFIKKTTLAKK